MFGGRLAVAVRGEEHMTTAPVEPVVETLRVSSRSQPNAVAGAIASIMRNGRRAEVQVVGAGALNQAVKAAAIARSFLVQSHIDLTIVPAFANIEIEGEGRTAIKLFIQSQ